MKVRRVLKERLHRGHIEVTLGLERSGGAAFAVNRELVGGYLRTFREVAEEFGVSAEPDLNAVLKLPGALNAAEDGDAIAALEKQVTAALEQCIERLNHMREEEGRGAAAELTQSHDAPFLCHPRSRSACAARCSRPITRRSTDACRSC